MLEPIVAIRCQVALDPGESTTLDLVSGAADSREACLALAAKYQDRHLANRVFDLAWTHSGVMLRQINATPGDAQVYRRLAGPVLYANAALRAEAGVLMRNQRGQSGLWGYAISGDSPDRAAEDRGFREHRARAATDPLPCLLAPEGPGRGPRDLERGAHRLPPAAPGPDHRADRDRRRSARGRPAGRHFRALCRTDLERGSRPAAGCGARHHLREPRQPGGTGEPAGTRRQERRAPGADPHPSPGAAGAARAAARRTSCSAITSADSRPTEPNTSSRPRSRR